MLDNDRGAQVVKPCVPIFSFAANSLLNFTAEFCILYSEGS